MKKVLVLTVNIALNTQLVFICSNSGIKTLGQFVKYVQSLYCKLWTDFTCFSDVSIVEFEQVNAAGISWIVERNIFQSRTQVLIKNST